MLNIYRQKAAQLFTVVLFSLMIISCGRDTDGGETETLPTVVIPHTETLKIDFKITKDIFPTNVKLEGIVTQNQNTSSIAGFLYSTTPNLTVNNSQATKNVTGSANYEVFITELQPNTTYYVKGFLKKSDGTYIYTSESSFKTTGYYGPGGGYVAYDKGESAEGWRYMEIYPVSLSYNAASATGGSWGDMGKFISGTYPDFGKGKENTDIIVSNTTSANCAAKLCKNLTKNGLKDWYLPSSQELLVISTELKKANINIPSYVWSSTQVNLNFAYATFRAMANLETPILTDAPKGQSNDILPARRY